MRYRSFRVRGPNGTLRTLGTFGTFGACSSARRGVPTSPSHDCESKMEMQLGLSWKTGLRGGDE